MSTARAGASQTVRVVASRLTDDTGPGLVETPLRVSTWIGFIGAWLLLAAGTTLLFIGSMQIMDVGGFCAEGGPYEIAVHCPASSGVSVTIALPMIAAGVLLGIFGARGFGVPAHGFFWTLLFGVEGIAFLISAFSIPEGVSVAWLICGVLFIGIAVPPLFMIRMGWPRSVFGRRRLDGRSSGKHGLPVRDATIIGVLWTMAVSSGAVIAVVLMVPSA